MIFRQMFLLIFEFFSISANTAIPQGIRLLNSGLIPNLPKWNLDGLLEARNIGFGSTYEC